MRSQKNVISLSQKPHQLCQIRSTRVEGIRTELCFLLETKSEGRVCLEMSLEQERKRELWGTHWEPAAQESPARAVTGEAHTARKGWHWGGNRWNWSLDLQDKVWAQELCSALHRLSPTEPTQGNHSAPDHCKLALTVLEGWVRQRQLWQAARGRGSTARVPNSSKIQANHRLTSICPAPRAGPWCHHPTRQLPAGLRRNLWPKSLYSLLKMSERWARPGTEENSAPAPWRAHFTNRWGKRQHRLTNMSVTVSGSGFSGKAS